MIQLAPRERPIDYAHLVIAFDGYDQPGTAYLTDQRLAWRSPTGNRFDFPLTACDGWAQKSDRPRQTGLLLGFPPKPGAKPAPLVLYPQQPRSAANRRLAVLFFQAVVTELGLIHPEWKTPQD